MATKKPVTASKIIKHQKKLPSKFQQHQEESQPTNKDLARSRSELESALGAYTDLYDLAPVGYFTLTRNGLVHQVNLAGEKLLGTNRNEATQLRFAAFVSSESQSDFEVFFEGLLQGEGKKTCELKIQKKGSGESWVHLEATCFEGGNVCRVMMTDITDRKRMELALQESENRFRMLLQDVSTVAVQGYVMDGTTQYWNTASEKLYGYSAQEAIGHNLLDLIIPPEMRDMVRQAIKQMAETGQPIPAAELSLMRKDGSRVAVYSSHAIVCVPGREPELFCLDIDLSERKRTEELFRESEWRNRIVSELTTDYVFVVDVEPGGDLKLRWASENMHHLTGRTVEDATTPDMWADIIHPDDKSRFFDFVSKILSTSEAGELECRTFYKDGGERWVRIFARPQINGSGNTTKIVGAIKDITNRKHAEVELEFTKESLKAANIELQAALLRQQQLAHTDALTGINNRRHLYILAEREIDIAMRYQQPLSVVMFDIDHFKKINDSFGHVIGDQVLQLVTQAARAELRSADVIGRYGGEEFVIVLPVTNAQQAYSLAERIRTGVEAIRVVTTKGEAAVTISIGIVEISSGRRSIEEMINAADEAMYIAKQVRNRTEIG